MTVNDDMTLSPVRFQKRCSHLSKSLKTSLPGKPEPAKSGERIVWIRARGRDA